ncbi:MAG: hypothetical protein QXY45_00625 [Candidatus Aenigmatarchaeota archaeon]
MSQQEERPGYITHQGRNIPASLVGFRLDAQGTESAIVEYNLRVPPSNMSYGGRYFLFVCSPFRKH